MDKLLETSSYILNNLEWIDDFKDVLDLRISLGHSLKHIGNLILAIFFKEKIIPK